MMKLSTIVGLCAGLAVLLSQASALDVKSSGVQILGDDFLEKTSDGRLYLIKFFAPWCGHCKRLAPAWGDLADSFAAQPAVVIASVDCTVAQAGCTKAGIEGYPTLKLYQNGEAVEVYKGSRDLVALKGYVQGQTDKLLKASVA